MIRPLFLILINIQGVNWNAASMLNRVAVRKTCARGEDYISTLICQNDRLDKVCQLVPCFAKMYSCKKEALYIQRLSFFLTKSRISSPPLAGQFRNPGIYPRFRFLVLFNVNFVAIIFRLGTYLVIFVPLQRCSEYCDFLHIKAVSFDGCQFLMIVSYGFKYVFSVHL